MMTANQEAHGDASEHELEQALRDLLAVLLPPSADGRVPGAVDVGIAEALRRESDYPMLREGLRRFIKDIHGNHGIAFAALDTVEQIRLVERLKLKDFRFFGMLANLAIKHYYQQPQIMALIGLEPRPSFPQGHMVEDGDLTLLEKVYERGRKYRE